MAHIIDSLRSEVQMDIEPLLVELRQEEEVPSDDSILTNFNDVAKTKNIGAVKKQLLEILDNIEKSVKAKMNRS